ncbi:family 34 glycosyltransferase [Trichoderma barbatum]
MSLSRSPSPVPGGGWSSPGLNINSGRSSPANAAGSAVSWESAKMRKQGANGYPSFSTQNQGFFTRHMRRISSSLPRFNSGPGNTYAEREKYERGGHSQNPSGGRIRSFLARIGRRLKWRILVPLIIFCTIVIYYGTHEAPGFVHWWRRISAGGGGEKFVIILAANVGGGVMEWKGAREWAIERDSVRNKRKYATRWGYDLEIVDMKTKKRYAHEWRESWEKVDFLRTAMRKYPKAEWFWWMDLNTYVMEPSYSLQRHMFNHLERHVYRDINEFNPLNITHPLTDEYLDADARSPEGDGNINSVNLMLSQDCSGFNLGSFFIRRSAWTEQLLDIWWDPVLYEQKHMEWEHKEQDALEQLYRTQPWIRQHTGFLPQRLINSFPPAACADESGLNNTRIHYNEKDRDFVVNMAGCEWGRDCWGEMYHYREFSYWLNRNPWELFKEEIVAVIWFKLTGQRVKL